MTVTAPSQVPAEPTSRPGRSRRLYVLMCSLSLLTGVAIGHINGMREAASGIVADCADRGITRIQNLGNDTDHLFHCFEIVPEPAREEPVRQSHTPPPMA